MTCQKPDIAAVRAATVKFGCVPPDDIQVTELMTK